MRRNSLTITAFYILLSVLVASSFILHENSPAALRALCREDGVVEYLTSVFYVLAAALFVIANRRNRFRNVFFRGLAAMCFFVAGEKISWGQRLIGFSTPAKLDNVNVQNEFNLHNIDGIHQRIRLLGVLVVGVLMLAVRMLNARVSRLAALLQRWGVPVMPFWLVGLAAVSVLVMVIPLLFYGAPVFSLNEVGKVLLALAFLLYALSFAFPIWETQPDMRTSIPRQILGDPI